jgi:hypothetical protein
MGGSPDDHICVSASILISFIGGALHVTCFTSIHWGTPDDHTQETLIDYRIPRGSLVHIINLATARNLSNTVHDFLP